MQDSITPEALEALNQRSLEAQQTYRACSGLSDLATMIDAHNAFGSALIDLYRTGQLILAQPSGDEVEAVARIVRQLVENCQYQRDAWFSEGVDTADALHFVGELQADLTAAIARLDAHRGKQKAPAKTQWFKEALERDRENAPDYGTHGRGWE